MDDLRIIANKIANGDWQRLPTKHDVGKLDFVALEERIYSALLEAAACPSQAIQSAYSQDRRYAISQPLGNLPFGNWLLSGP